MTTPYAWPTDSTAADVTFGPSAYVWPADSAAANVDFTADEGSGPSSQTVQVTSLQGSHFGTPQLFFPPTDVFPTPLRGSHFGTPTVPNARTVSVASLHRSHFGTPTSVRYTPLKRNLLAHVYRLRVVRFGTPSV